jgi:5,10-methylenetetrahydrofolate reductase
MIPVYIYIYPIIKKKNLKKKKNWQPKIHYNKCGVLIIEEKKLAIEKFSHLECGD